MNVTNKIHKKQGAETKNIFFLIIAHILEKNYKIDLKCIDTVPDLMNTKLFNVGNYFQFVKNSNDAVNF